jgi:parvulin-like peptidyl-prolyl isomerase
LAEVPRALYHRRTPREFHRRKFDGTEIDVSHILVRPKPGVSPQTTEELIKQAAAIRETITSGKLSFAEAARKHSTGPSAKEGGHLGCIPRRGVMDEAFSRAAFSLEVGQVSQPVTTPFGVHLIRCEAIKPGGKRFEEVREPLEEALGRELLEKIARLERGHAPVAFTGKAPNFKPDTRELAIPTGSR